MSVTDIAVDFDYESLVYETGIKLASAYQIKHNFLFLSVIFDSVTTQRLFEKSVEDILFHFMASNGEIGDTNLDDHVVTTSL
mgnify:CR=1 FL=1